MDYAALKTAKQRAWEAVRKIDGSLSEREAGALFELAAESSGPIIEIGAGAGACRSTAALALGSMWGKHQEVFACIGLSDGGSLRESLDSVGVNGLVKIVAFPEGDCEVLVLNGGKDWIRRDLETHLPKVRDKGRVLVRGYGDLAEAVDQALSAKSLEWLPQKQTESYAIFQRRTAVQHQVMLALPGPTWKYCAVQGVLEASRVHQLAVQNSGNGFDDMNLLWVQALNMARRGDCTHFAMLHSDVAPIPLWLDKLLAELDDHDADLVSAVWRLKEPTGCTSSGIGDWDNPWGAFRRFTSNELLDYPATFSIADTPYPDKFLLHNTGCFVADLRKDLWRTVDEHGYLKCTFSFPIAAQLQADGEITHLRESEDWYFSRRIAELGARTYITRRVYGAHVGDFPFHTNEPGAWQNGDEGTAENWRSPAERMRSAAHEGDPGLAPDDPRREPQTPIPGDTRPPNVSAGPQSIQESIQRR